MKNDLMQCDKKNTSQEMGNRFAQDKGIKHQGSWNSAIKNGEVSQKEKDNIVWYQYCMTSIVWYLKEESHNKMIQMNLFTKQKQTHKLREHTYGQQEGALRNLELTCTHCNI